MIITAKEAFKVEKVRYMISDAANLIQVESHVLRYWEEELDLDIPRNEMGHRYYTEENIRQFEQIKKLKEDGYQLKAIKMLVHNKNPEQEDVFSGSEKKKESSEHKLPAKTNTRIDKLEESRGKLSQLEQFQLLMNDIVKNAIAENNQALGQAVSTQVGEKVIKEMNYLMREREELEEERFRKLDEAIRTRQKLRRKDRVRESRKKDKPRRIGAISKESMS